MLSGEIAKVYGDEGLPEDTITLNFKGSAGQSFGAFAVKGLKMVLEGRLMIILAKAYQEERLSLFLQKNQALNHMKILLQEIHYYMVPLQEKYIF